MSSGIPTTGCVSLSWMAAFRGSSSQLSFRMRKRRRMSRIEQLTKKYCCWSRSSWPWGVESLG